MPFYVIRLIRDQDNNPINGFIQSYNPNGKGEVTLTKISRKAKKFVSKQEAFLYHQHYPIRVFEASIEEVK